MLFTTSKVVLEYYILQQWFGSLCLVLLVHNRWLAIQRETRNRDSSNMVKSSLTAIDFNDNRNIQPSNSNISQLKWCLVAKILDRLCFSIYFVAIIASYVLYYPKP